MSRKSTLLARRCEEHGIEEPSFQVTGEDVVVWRFPPIQVSPGGLIIPEDARSPNVKGILLGWGPKAADALESHGYELGHVVVWKRFAGWEINDRTPEERRGNRILFLKGTDLLGSDDLATQIKLGVAKFVKIDGRYTLQRKLISARKGKVLAIAASPGATPEERKTARRIARTLA